MNDLNAPATKADLQEVKGELSQVKDDVVQVKRELADKATKADLQTLRDDLQTAIQVSGQQLKDGLSETMRDLQTEVLKAFYSYAKSAEANFAEVEVGNHLIRQRVSAVESRVTEIERRLYLPPTA